MKTYHLLLPLLACTVPMNISAGKNYVVEEATHDALVTAIGKCTSTNPNDPDMVTFCIKDKNNIAVTSIIALGSKAIIIDGFNNATKNYIVLDGTTPGRIFSNAKGANVELKNLKLTGCNNIVWPISGGANTNVFLNQCDFYDNDGTTKSNNGSAIRCNGANLKVYNCNFSNNICNGTYGGGAICFYNSGTNSAILEVEGSSFINNKSLNEGGSFPYPGGGAICIFPSAETSKNTKASIKNTTFYGNSAYRGGAVYVKSASTAEALNVEFINNTIAANSAVDNGGGLCFVGKESTKVNIALINNLITNNGHEKDVNDFGWYNLEERVFITAYNNIVTESSAFYKTFVNVTPSNGNQQIQDMTSIYKEVQTATVGSATLDVPVLDGVFYKVAPLCEGSVASGAGIATLEGYTIPTKDAAGNARPETPAVGAMEISNNVPTAVEGISSSEMKLNKMGNQLVVTGIESGVVNVYNLLGELVLSSSIDETKTMSIESLSNGIYVANIESVSFKFIK